LVTVSLPASDPARPCTSTHELLHVLAIRISLLLDALPLLFANVDELQSRLNVVVQLIPLDEPSFVNTLLSFVELECPYSPENE
jgi:hypothetical protein